MAAPDLGYKTLWFTNTFRLVTSLYMIIVLYQTDKRGTCMHTIPSPFLDLRHPWHPHRLDFWETS
jgi:hypothetical protein